MLLFPLLASISSVAYMLAIIFPSGLLAVMENSGEEQVVIGLLQYALLFVIYLGLAFIATFFNVCVVYTTKTRFEGGDATFMDSIKFAISKTGIIFQWSMISATVGIVFALLDRLAERLGGIGEILMKIVRGLLGAVWSIITIFVVPTLVYEDVSPKEAIKISTEVIKKTWGESLARHFGLGLIQFFVILAIIGGTFGLSIIVPPETGTIIVVAIGFLAFIGCILVFNVANTVFNTALYVYASTGEEPKAFNTADDMLANAFRVK